MERCSIFALVWICCGCLVQTNHEEPPGATTTLQAKRKTNNYVDDGNSLFSFGRIDTTCRSRSRITTERRRSRAHAINPSIHPSFCIPRICVNQILCALSDFTHLACTTVCTLEVTYIQGIYCTTLQYFEYEKRILNWTPRRSGTERHHLTTLLLPWLDS